MGELINFQEWKAEREEAEELALKEELDRLQVQVRDLIDDMGHHTGPYIYPPELTCLVPQLTHIDHLLDGYYDAWLGLKPGPDNVAWSDDEESEDPEKPDV